MPSLHCSGSSANASHTPSTAAAKSKAGKNISPQANAAKQRVQTLKQFNTATAAAETASTMAEDVLNEAADVYGSFEVAVEGDPNIKTLSHRLECLKLLMDLSATRSAGDTGEIILEHLEADEFFKDQNWQARRVHTIGFMNYVRHTMLELQRTNDQVEELMQNHKDAIDVLKKVAGAVERVASQWKSNQIALMKARALEEKAQAKEAERVKKAAEKQAAKEAAKQKRAEEAAERKRRAALAAEEGIPQPDDQEDKTKTRRRKKANAELGEDDLPLLQAIVRPDWPSKCELNVLDTPQAMINNVVLTSGMLPMVARCRRSTLKKCLDDPCLLWRKCKQAFMF